MIRLLPTKYRNSKAIDQFVAGAIKEKGGYKDESDNQNPLKLYYHLENRHPLLPSGYQPIWVNVEQLDMEDLKPSLEKLTKGFEDETIVLSRLNLSIYKELCDEMNWKYARVRDIIGTECKCLITFGIPNHQNLEELMSRARNSLIIITEEKR